MVLLPGSVSTPTGTPLPNRRPAPGDLPSTLALAFLLMLTMLAQQLQSRDLHLFLLMLMDLVFNSITSQTPGQHILLTPVLDKVLTLLPPLHLPTQITYLEYRLILLRIFAYPPTSH